ncbi:hypothetical protein MA16_Dca027388 [Dendrobium catenatum]|uniref:Uncharacterized protein n=1 Tax=Dendrobium catenatum TaxID=906689 RepID=A0A2I0VYW1_9ASPA|nr:hypothetical protein MA16_Dca027388 [Dendrobium catenatum]
MLQYPNKIYSGLIESTYIPSPKVLFFGYCTNSCFFDTQQGGQNPSPLQGGE